jgi:hypothetical protein
MYKHFLRITGNAFIILIIYNLIQIENTNSYFHSGIVIRNNIISTAPAIIPTPTPTRIPIPTPTPTPKKCHNNHDHDDHHHKDNHDCDKHNHPDDKPHFHTHWSTDKHKFGFSIHGLSKYKKIHYVITYDWNGHTEGIIGDKDLDNDNFNKEDIIFGTCSTQESCTYHDAKNIKIICDLINSDNSVEHFEKSLKN